MKERIWECKIGGAVDDLPPGADFPMRNAVAEAFEKLTGRTAEFNFSGWGSKLNEYERAVVENRKPEISGAPKLTTCRHCGFRVALNEAPAQGADGPPPLPDGAFTQGGVWYGPDAYSKKQVLERDAVWQERLDAARRANEQDAALQALVDQAQAMGEYGDPDARRWQALRWLATSGVDTDAVLDPILERICPDDEDRNPRPEEIDALGDALIAVMNDRKEKP